MKKKVLIIGANYYEDILKNLTSFAEKLLEKKKIKYKSIIVPGVFEIPVIISKNIKKYDGFIALGCVIKGETPHFDFISKATTNGLMNISINYGKPVGNGILTCLNQNQALVRSKSKGQEAAHAVISILSL